MGPLTHGTNFYFLRLQNQMGNPHVKNSVSTISTFLCKHLVQ